MWVCKHAAQHQLKAMAPAVLQAGFGFGGDFSVWVCRHAAQHQLKAMPPSALQAGSGVGGRRVNVVQCCCRQILKLRAAQGQCGAVLLQTDFEVSRSPGSM